MALGLYMVHVYCYVVAYSFYVFKMKQDLIERFARYVCWHCLCNGVYFYGLESKWSVVFFSKK